MSHLQPLFANVLALWLLAGAQIAWSQQQLSPPLQQPLEQQPPARQQSPAVPGAPSGLGAMLPDNSRQATAPKTAVFAGGCFWSMESDFERAVGVLDVVSGYSGGRSKNPNYRTYAQRGHREVVIVSYDPKRITFAGLCEFFLKHIDPTDRRGSFVDRGSQYSPAIYFADQAEEAMALNVINAVENLKVFRKKIGVEVLPRAEFWLAEDYHQNYHGKNPVEYATYRANCGRDAFVRQHWGRFADQLTLPSSFPAPAAKEEPANIAGQRETTAGELSGPPAAKLKPWQEFVKPEPAVLRERLDLMQYKVTQSDFTEPAFRNRYFDHHAAGIYVDVVSGEPLFASLHKFESGTGWPSFTRPIEPNVVFKVDRSEGEARVEVRSKYADSHLGHVFNDGPASQGGMRYCMNSAALRFIPVASLEQEGYGEYALLFR